MKKQNKTALAKASKKVDNHQAATTALTVRLNEIVFPKGVETLGQKADFLHGYSVEASKRANGAAIMAGWVLSVARETCAHGQWMAWLAQNVSFSQQTATNYMNLYARTLGKARAEARRPIALNVEPTVAELEAAAHDVDGSTLAALYKSTRIMAANPDHGGKREGAGRKKKDEDAEVAAKLDEVANSPALLIAAIREPISTVYKAWRERDVFARIEMSDLALVTASLQELATAATAALKARSKK